MGKLLDRLAQHFWLPWLVCICLAAVTAFLPAPDNSLQLVIGIVVFALMLIAVSGYMMGGALAFFDIGSGLVMPLAASIIVPQQLMARRELDAFRASLRTTS